MIFKSLLGYNTEQWKSEIKWQICSSYQILENMWSPRLSLIMWGFFSNVRNIILSFTKMSDMI